MSIGLKLSEVHKTENGWSQIKTEIKVDEIYPKWMFWKPRIVPTNYTLSFWVKSENGVLLNSPTIVE